MRFLFYFIVNFSLIIYAQQESNSNEQFSDEMLISFIDSDTKALLEVKDQYAAGNKLLALSDLANYYKTKMCSKFFFNWKNFDSRYVDYLDSYPSKENEHIRRTSEHLALFSDSTSWKLPLIGLNGKNISAYELRHLARQHKMIDVAFSFYINNDSDYLNYFNNQVRSLYQSYFNNNYEKNGNDVFEYYRSGYRVFNWLIVHNLLLASDQYEEYDQLMMIKTFLYHGEDLYKKTKKYNPGNHHTKGVMALALISILFNEFEQAQLWFTHSISQLQRHLDEEINTDGFQFERSIHYHIGDIDNYFYVYYLASINDIKLPEVFTSKLKSMFNSLVKLALPNKKLPVLQDDTDEPWAEYNSISETMYLGSLLFDDTSLKYFSSKKPASSKYWLIRREDLNRTNTNYLAPKIGSTTLSQTGYYIMRNGWETNSKVMIISSGLSKIKPDHQHGDMLGIYTYANDNIVLPNYQVRYFLDDYSFFKNSFVKNVAIVDSIQHGKRWKGNRGGSGFGKFLELPTPETITWLTSEDFDLFIGTHDGYTNIGVNYFRKIIFIKDGFWIVRDDFHSKDDHNYQQVWQGHFTEENTNHLRTTFANGSGLDIIQLNENDFNYNYSKFRGKGNVVVNCNYNGDFNYTTILYPFAHFEERGIIKESISLPSASKWNFHKEKIELDNIQIKSGNIIHKNDIFVCLNLSSINLPKRNFIALTEGDYIIKVSEKGIKVYDFNDIPRKIVFNEKMLINRKNHTSEVETLNLVPGEIVTVNFSK